MAGTDDWYCLMCLDLGRSLPRLPDEAKDLIAQQLDSKDLGSCLLATSTSFAWKFTKYYLSEIRWQIELTGLLTGLYAATRATTRDLASITGTSRTQLLQRKEVQSRLDRLFAHAHNSLCTITARREACVARALEAGVCSAFCMQRISDLSRVLDM